MRFLVLDKRRGLHLERMALFRYFLLPSCFPEMGGEERQREREGGRDSNLLQL